MCLSIAFYFYIFDWSLYIVLIINKFFIILYWLLYFYFRKPLNIDDYTTFKMILKSINSYNN